MSRIRFATEKTRVPHLARNGPEIGKSHLRGIRAITLTKQRGIRKFGKFRMARISTDVQKRMIRKSGTMGAEISHRRIDGVRFANAVVLPIRKSRVYHGWSVEGGSAGDPVIRDIADERYPHITFKSGESGNSGNFG